jgi:excinuclease ABC subunit C
MVGLIDDIEIILTENETESLILETNLIKENLPKYNILMKD